MDWHRGEQEAMLARRDSRTRRGGRSSETDITYADAPRDSDADVTTRFALEGQARRAHEAEEAAAAAAPAPRAPSLAGTSVSKAWSQRKKNCAFGPGGWQWREGTKLPHPDDPPAGYPPSVFALQPPSSSPQSHHQPLPEHSPPISRSNLLLEPFLTADRAVKQDLGPGFRKLSRTKSRVEEWRDEVAGRTSVDAEERDYEGQEEYGGGEEEEEDEMVSGEMEQDENELPSPSDAHKKPLKPSQNAAASPSSPVASSTPLKRPRPPLPAPSPFPNLSSPPSRALSSPNLNTGSSPKKVYKTKDIVKLLPKRRRRVVGKALRERQVRVPQADSSAEEEEEDDDEGEEEEGSEAETDYELFSAPHHCRPAARTKSSQGKSSKKKASTYSSKQTKKRTVPSSGRKGTKSRRRKTDENEEEEEDSETERRKEAARRKWAAVDGYQLETVRTLY
ncbi:hypothetical protein JCM8547_005012 [Rhodosporidiobolus lusitaniae]